MSPETGLNLNWSEFDKKFYDLVEKAIPGDAQKGLRKAMDEILSDSIELPPQAPKEIGDLWGSTADTVKVETKYKKLSVRGGFNIAYAHRHHEAEPGSFKYTTDKGARQPGPKFMISKMINFGRKYMGIVADTIRNRGR